MATRSKRPSVESAGIAAGSTVVTVDVLLLFAGCVSGLDDVTDAVFATGPGVTGGFTTRDTVAEPPLAMVPRVQVTVVSRRCRFPDSASPTRTSLLPEGHP